jgi:hypothetical protein
MSHDQHAGREGEISVARRGHGSKHQARGQFPQEIPVERPGRRSNAPAGVSVPSARGKL